MIHTVSPFNGTSKYLKTVVTLWETNGDAKHVEDAEDLDFGKVVRFKRSVKTKGSLGNGKSDNHAKAKKWVKHKKHVAT